jgi:hypothetical protein
MTSHTGSNGGSGGSHARTAHSSTPLNHARATSVEADGDENDQVDDDRDSCLDDPEWRESIERAEIVEKYEQVCSGDSVVEYVEWCAC